MFGSQVTALALPLLAVTTLGADAAHMATLWGVQFLPNLLIGLFAGAWIDRLPRRPVLIAADLGRAALLLALTLAGAWGVLRVEALFVVAGLVGALNVFADIADNAYLPALVGRDHLVEANAKLGASGSVAAVAGPGIAGVLIDVLRASGAIVIDAFSFLLSACALLLIDTREPARKVTTERSHIWQEISEGLRTTYRNPILRAFICMTVSFDLFWNMLFALYFLYVTRDLQLPATAIGIVFGVGSTGALLGSLVANRVALRLGIGRTIIGAQIVLGLTVPLIALPQWLPSLALPLLVVAEFVLSFAGSLSWINRGSLVQAITPDRLLGRVGASRNVISLGIVPVGALLGGILGEQIGIPATILVAACGGLPSFVWMLFSPVRHIRTMPTNHP
jgi:MFS family permease